MLDGSQQASLRTVLWGDARGLPEAVEDPGVQNDLRLGVISRKKIAQASDR